MKKKGVISVELATYFPIWDKLTEQQQSWLREAAEYKQVQAGTVLHDGSPACMGMLLVKSGQLRAYMLSEEGREVTVARFFEMDSCLYSASCVMPSMQFDIFVEAEKDSQLWVIPAYLYKKLMEQSLAFSNYSHELITSHFSDLIWLMEQIMWKSVDKRLAQFLLEESVVEDSTELKLTHEKIANHMGTAREVITRMLRYFQSENMVRLTRGAVELLDIKKLKTLALD